MTVDSIITRHTITILGSIQGRRLGPLRYRLHTQHNTLCIMLLQATIVRHYFVKTQTSVASFGPPDLSIIF